MQRLGEYLLVGQKLLRCGYTTGTCAAAATRAAAELLLCGRTLPAVAIQTPSGHEVRVDVEEHAAGDGWAQCAVRKDAGDDPDVTDGVLVRARVEFCDAPGIRIDGGEGVGRVTLPGLDQPVGSAAINSVPRQMIGGQMEAALKALHGGLGKGALDARGFQVVISVPGGEGLASRTFNPRLGIEGGISIIGTSGIVKPMSEDALISSIELELRTLRARGMRDLLVVPGNYGRDFARGQLQLALDDALQCSNYFGATLDAAAVLGFSRMLIVGHLGKMAKVAGGIMNTHSRVADCRMEVLAAHAALAGASREVLARIMQAATTDAALDILETCGLVSATMDSLMGALAGKLARRAGDSLRVEAIVFSRQHGLLGETPGARLLAQAWRCAEASPFHAAQFGGGDAGKGGMR